MDMQPITCELCGSNDVVKEDGMFVCKHCGTKYDLEEAKKLLGTVQLDDTGKIPNYLSMTTAAYDVNNFAESEQYCNKIIEIDAENVYAWLYKGMAAGWQSTVAQPRVDEAVQCFIKAIQFADSEHAADIWEKASTALKNLSISMAGTIVDFYLKYGDPNMNKRVYEQKYQYLKSDLAMNTAYIAHFAGQPPKETDTRDISLMMDEIFVQKSIACWNQTFREYRQSNDGYPTDVVFQSTAYTNLRTTSLVEYVIPKSLTGLDAAHKDLAIKACSGAIQMRQDAMSLVSYQYGRSNLDGSYKWIVDKSFDDNYKQEHAGKIRFLHEKIQSLNPSHSIPEVTIPKKPGGCYVATCVYGSYDCPEVWTLRRYRDEKLATTRRGRGLIQAYYTVSPVIVKHFGHKAWFSRYWKGRLDLMVKKLQREGFANTAYRDKEW